MPDGKKKLPRYIAKDTTPIPTRLDYMGIPNVSDGEVMDWMKSYINSSKYKKRLSSFYSNPEEIAKRRLDKLETTDIVNDVDPSRYGPGVYFRENNRVILNNDEISSYNDTRYGTLAHELGHAVNSGLESNLRLSPAEELYMFSRESKLGKYAAESLNSKAYNQNVTLSNLVTNALGEHDSAPAELKSDIDSFRFQLKKLGIYDAGAEDMNIEILNKAKKDIRLFNNFDFKRLQNHYNDNDLIEIMNNIAGNSNIEQPLVKRGGTIKSKMKNSYQLAGNVQLPGFLGDLYNSGQNLGITNMDIGLNALNYFGNLFAEKRADRDNRAYQDYWQRQYQIPESAVNPFAFGDPNQMAMGGRVKFKGPGFKFKGTMDMFNNMFANTQPEPFSGWTQDDMTRLGFPEMNAITGMPLMKDGGIHIKLENKGKFTRWAKSHGMGVQEAARKVLAADEGVYSPSVRKMANFARNFGGNKAYGGTYMIGGPIPFGYYLDKKTRTLKSLFKGGTFYKHGGEVNYTAKEVEDEDANIEAEKGEYIFGTGFGQNPFAETSNIGVGLYKIDGNKHYNGGTKLRANPGDFIFSDDKSLSFTEETVESITGKKEAKKLNRTPAKVASKYNSLNKFISMAQNSKEMPLDRKTALLNVENMVDKLADIAIGQEALKGFPAGIPQFAQVSLEKRAMPMEQNGELDPEAASIPMAKYGGQVKRKYQTAGPVLPFITSLLSNIPGDPWKGDKTKDRKGVFQNPQDNQFPGSYPDFERRISGAGFSGDINNNREIQRFLYNNLMQNPQGRERLANMWNQYGITNYGQQLAGMNLPANFAMDQLQDPQSDESVRLQNWGNFYDDNKIGVRTRMLADGLTQPNPPGITGYPGTGVPGDPGIETNVPGLVLPPTQQPPAPGDPQITTRNYNTPVNMNIAEAYGFMAANRRYAPRYPTAQRFYEGENIDATLNAGFQPISAQPILNNIQRQMNVFNENNSGYGPISYARNSYAFTQALNAQNSAIAQTQLQNVQRRDQLTQSLAQNQALKGQYRLQLQDKYLRELETLNNNREQASKNRMAQNANLLNSFVNRAYTQKYSNAMMDYFEMDPNGNLRPRAGQNLRQAVMQQTNGNQMNTQLRYAEQLFKLMQQYGVKGSGFVDDVLKGK